MRAQLGRDLASDAAMAILLQQMQVLAGGDAVDGCTLAGLEKRAGALQVQIARSVDLAAQLDDPAPVLRRVHALAHQQAQQPFDLAALHARRARLGAVRTNTPNQHIDPSAPAATAPAGRHRSRVRRRATA